MDYTYTVKGEQVKLQVDPTMVAVRFRDDLPPSARANALKGLTQPYATRKHLPGERYSILEFRTLARFDSPNGKRKRGPLTAKMAERAAKTAGKWMAELALAPGVEEVTPVFTVGLSRAIAPDRVIVGFKEGVDGDKQLQALGLEVVGEPTSREFLVRVPAGENTFSLARRLAERTEVEYAEPDFAVWMLPFPAGSPAPPPVPGEGLSSRQYALAKVGADKALRVHPGNSAIRVAVLDSGIDTGHPDLHGVTVAEVDAETDDPFQEPHPLNGHGTACAGLAVALSPDRTGSCGVGSGCSLIAIKIGHATSRTGQGVARVDTAARGIDAAWKLDADVISLSWVFPVSARLENAIERALTKGRGTKGCVVVAPTGNGAGGVEFPATLKNVLAVAASRVDDTPREPENDNWGSAYGEQVDIAAPGVSLFTTDVMGAHGYDVHDSPDGDYTDSFYGTSAATPLVAGAAALMLSVHPELKEADVRRILMDTADQVGGETYDSVTGRNDRMGHGRLNVLAAMRLAAQEAGRNDVVAAIDALKTKAGPAPAGGADPLHGAAPADSGETVASPPRARTRRTKRKPALR